MKKYYVRARITKEQFDRREKSVELRTIYGNVFAPKSKMIVESVEPVKELKIGDEVYLDKTQSMVVLIPSWVFWKNNLNPCQLETGYIEQIVID